MFVIKICISQNRIYHRNTVYVLNMLAFMTLNFIKYISFKSCEVTQALHAIKFEHITSIHMQSITMIQILFVYKMFIC